VKISHGTRIKNINDRNGYGVATVRMLESLSRLGYEVNSNDRTADVEIWFDQPQHWKFSKGPYKIGYMPWESTLLLDDWADIMNRCDEIWTPSPLIAKWYREHAGITVPVYTYLHGVDDIWTKKPRKVNDKMKFLHVGMEAARKGGSETMRAYRVAFPKAEDVSLTMKTMPSGFNVPLRGIEVVKQSLTEPELVNLFHDHHVYVYPSWGEGFGLTPLQAIATGMPTITLPAWAPYAKYLDKDLNISSRLVTSPWKRTLHPGKMYKPKFTDIVESMRYAYDHYDEVHARAQARTEAIQAEYDWDKITSKVFADLEQRLQK
jgi:hypothetical protein